MTDYAKAIKAAGEQLAEDHAFDSSAALVDPKKYYAYLAGYEKLAKALEVLATVHRQPEVREWIGYPYFIVGDTLASFERTLAGGGQ